jgi:hypothetical protein
MSTLKEAKEIDDEEEDAGITIKVNILSGKNFWREYFWREFFFGANIFWRQFRKFGKRF